MSLRSTHMKVFGKEIPNWLCVLGILCCCAAVSGGGYLLLKPTGENKVPNVIVSNPATNGEITETVAPSSESSNLIKSSFKITGIQLTDVESNTSLKADIVNATQTSFCTATQTVDGFSC
eukprot:643969_1